MTRDATLVEVVAIFIAALLFIALTYVSVNYYSSTYTKTPISVPSNYGECRDAPVVAVIHSLKTEPFKWDTDLYTLTNKDVSVWVANEDYGLSITVGGRAKPDMYQLDDACRAELYSSIQNWMRISIANRLRD